MISEDLDVMTEQASDGMMMIVSSEMGFARRDADLLVFMDEGKSVEATEPEAFFEAPASARTRRFQSQIVAARG